MAERVSTGGNVSFEYQKGNSPRLDQKHKDEIRDAYARADERKRNAKRNKTLFIILIALFIIALLYFVLS